MEIKNNNTMKNQFLISDSEKGRILNLHESRKDDHGTSLLTERPLVCDFSADGYVDATSDFTKPDGVIFLPDGEYENLDATREDKGFVLAKNGKPTGYAVCLKGLEGFKSNTVKKITVKTHGTPPVQGAGISSPKAHPITRIWLNDKLLRKSGLSTK